MKTTHAALLLLLGAATAPAESATVNVVFHASSGTLTIKGAGGATLNVWGYSTNGAATVPGPTLTVTEGDRVNVTLVNHLSRAHNFVVRKVSTDTGATPAGGSHTYSFTAPAAGSYVYGDTLNNSVNREMGLHGALIVRPSGGSRTAWTGGPAYDVERIWVLSDMDKSRWNDVAAGGGVVNTAVYKPNYSMMNGLGGFDAMNDKRVTIRGQVGETALVRIVNGGLFSHSLHFHGNHVRVIAVNGVHKAAPFQLRDTLNVPPSSSADVLYKLNQPGDYPMHIHTAQMETANGVYLNGTATMITMY